MSDRLRVLITGASGYIATHCILKLLQEGYIVRGTLRSLEKAERLRNLFGDYLTSDDQLEFVVADLTADDGWDTAVQDCTYLLHTASPIPGAQHQKLEDFIEPAVSGTKRVLSAAGRAGIKRVVVTSSVSAIQDDTQYKPNHILTEEDWANPDKAPPYGASKTLAERTAWELADKVGFEMATINPVYVLGPVFDKRHSGSLDIIRSALNKSYPAVPNLSFAIVDVRDVAAAHVIAMNHPDAAGKRFILHSEAVWYIDMIKLLNKHFADRGYKLSTRKMPDFLLRIFALFDVNVRTVAPDLGRQWLYSNSQMKDILGIIPRTAEEIIVDTGNSLIEKGIVLP